MVGAAAAAVAALSVEPIPAKSAAAATVSGTANMYDIGRLTHTSR
ncbi:hypothetical protein MMSP_4073 [Mycobacterium sp. 012931]|nr:hypothetical protein MMSP_4073 [Mycobacterium sp. 012931]